MPPRTYTVAPGYVLHVDIPGRGRHLGIVLDRGPSGEVVFAVATSGDWKTERLRRQIDFSAEPARSWISDWPRDNHEISYFYGGFIGVQPPDRWIRVVGEVPQSVVEALVDLFAEWAARKQGTPLPPGPIRIPPA